MDASLKGAFFDKKKLFLDLNQELSKPTSNYGDSSPTCPFVKQRCPSIDTKSAFSRAIWFNSSFWINDFLIFHIFVLKHFYHIFIAIVFNLKLLQHSQMLFAFPNINTQWGGCTQAFLWQWFLFPKNRMTLNSNP